MKKILVCITVITLAIISLRTAAQPKPSADDIAKALKGGRLFFHTSKALLEADEQAVLNIKLTIPRTATAETQLTEGSPYFIDLPDGSDPNIPAAYKATNWKIIQGGGKISGIESNSCVYSAPSKAPQDKIMVISVDLEPTSSALPKVVLLQTLYFVEDETAIVVNLPEVGFRNQKYVTTTGGGMNMPGVTGLDSRAAGHVDAATMAKLAQAQAAVANAQQSSGINLSAITSNAMAYYDEKTGVTAIKFKQLSMQMQDGKDMRGTAVSKGETIMTEISFKGKGLGIHKLDDKDAGLGMLVLMSKKGCGCGNNKNGETDEAPCNGYINIKSSDGKVIRGDFAAEVYSAVDNRMVHGIIYGKFTVNIANSK